MFKFLGIKFDWKKSELIDIPISFNFTITERDVTLTLKFQGIADNQKRIWIWIKAKPQNTKSNRGKQYIELNISKPTKLYSYN